jgi:hypothetical protein
VPVKALNQAIRRNLDRFPDDFAFQVDRAELENLKSQIVTPSCGGALSLPYAFAEQGALTQPKGLLHPQNYTTL